MDPLGPRKTLEDTDYLDRLKKEDKNYVAAKI